MFLASDGITLDYSSILASLSSHFWIGLVAFLLIIIWTQRADMILLIKEYLKSKSSALETRTIEITKINDRYFTLYENNTKAIDKISEAIVTFKEALLTVEGRIINKIDQEMESVRGEIRNDKIEKIAATIREKSNPGYSAPDEMYNSGVKNGNNLFTAPIKPPL